MSRMQFATDELDPHIRLIAGVIGVVGLGAALLVGAMAISAAIEYLGAPFVALVLGLWMAGSIYVKAWNRWSPWSPKTNREEA